MKFDFILEDGQIYRMEIGWNFEKYRVVKGYLYRGFQRIGKIVEVRVVV